MLIAAAGHKIATGSPEEISLDNRSLTIHQLGDEHKAEVLGFLRARPVHTVFMAGFIHDNGLQSDFNRGAFYACRDGAGNLEGVALIGHSTFVETQSEAALEAFARLAQDCSSAYMILGEQETVERFWKKFSASGQTPRRVCREMFYEQQWPAESSEPVDGLRQATADDIEIVLPVYARMVFEESGIDPMETDPEGFSRRWLRRINQGRVWAWIENDELIFNADIMCETPDAIYLEGIRVSDDKRGKGYGLRCMSQLSRSLLTRVKSLCLLSNEKNRAAQAFYTRAGFKPLGYYDSIFLRRKN